MRFKTLLLSLCLSSLSACTYSVHLVQTSEDGPIGRRSEVQQIHADTSQFVIMGFVAQTDYVDQAYSQLKSKCDGSISHITTKYYTDHGFFSWTNHLSLDGECLKN